MQVCVIFCDYLTKFDSENYRGILMYFFGTTAWVLMFGTWTLFCCGKKDVDVWSGTEAYTTEDIEGIIEDAGAGGAQKVYEGLRERQRASQRKSKKELSKKLSEASAGGETGANNYGSTASAGGETAETSSKKPKDDVIKVSGVKVDLAPGVKLA